MAARRKGPRKRQQGNSSHTMIWSLSSAALIFTLCLCSFDFDLNGEPLTRLETCRATCDTRLQSAAFESHVPSSLLSPAAFDSLFLRQEAHKSTFQDRFDQHFHATQANYMLKSSQTRPRRLPTLIKILTGFGDEDVSDGGDKSIVARIEKPEFLTQATQRRGIELLTHEDSVQIAAAAAATAAFSKSTRLFGNNRMQRVNFEWDSALRWIAGWDQNHHRQRISSPLGGGNDLESPIRANDNSGSLHDARQDGFNDFVDDLARMLEECISQCVADEHFEARLKKDGGSGNVSLGSFSIGNMILRSLFGLSVGSSFPQLSVGKLGMISSESRIIMARAFQVVASSAAAYLVHSLWSWASPVLHQWYSSLGYTESPEWLLEHEKQLKLAKTCKSRYKKKAKRKQAHRQPSNRSKAVPSNDGVHKQSLDRKPSANIPGPDLAASHIRLAAKPHDIRDKPLKVTSTETWQHPPPSRELSSKDSVSDSQGSTITEGIPSIISYPSTSASSSPSLKPIGSHLEDRIIPHGAALQALPEPSPCLTSPLGRQGSFFPQLAHQNALSVPTQEQRNEAARQLREFQNAQIQRLLLQRKLSQGSTVSYLSDSTAHKGSGLISEAIVHEGSRFYSASSFHFVENRSATAPSGQRSNVLRPPPGLPHPSEALYNSVQQNQDDKAFLTDNELFLSKLLDDEEDDDMVMPSSLAHGIESMSREVSLDPSAVPFVSSGKVGSTQVAAAEAARFPKMKDDEGDIWKSVQNDTLLKKDSPVRIKGVYGGSVW